MQQVCGIFGETCLTCTINTTVHISLILNATDSFVGIQNVEAVWCYLPEKISALQL